jgi:Uma2 family endonuclease
VEIDITSSSLDRFAIYQALGVPEIWRYDGKALEIYILQANQYVAQSCSVALPPLLASDILTFLNLRQTTGENALVKQFHQWVRQQI